jgi:hypothetical protein
MGSFAYSNDVDKSDTFKCVATNNSAVWGPGGSYLKCPPTGPTVTWAATTFVVPQGHSGVLFFSFKTLVQAGPQDLGGFIVARIAIDGQPLGSQAVQALQAPACDSTRTISATYLSSESPLRPGRHTLEVDVQTTGNFEHMMLSTSVSLVWFG